MSGRRKVTVAQVDRLITVAYDASGSLDEARDALVILDDPATARAHLRDALRRAESLASRIRKTLDLAATPPSRPARDGGK